MAPSGPTASARRADSPLLSLRSAAQRLRTRSLPLRPLYRVAVLALMTTAITLIGGVLAYLLEAGLPGAQIHSIGDGIWWAVVTMTTVGYGDKVPLTPAGRLVGVGLMVSGIGLAALGMATLISVLVAENLADRRRAARRIRRGFRDLRRNQFAAATALAVTFLLIGGLLAWIFESDDPHSQVHTYWDGLWWAIVTMATVGYGDVVPHTGVGRVVAVALMLGGITTVSLMTASIASGLVAENLKEARGLDTIRGGGHILLCGWNQHAERVIDGMAASVTDPGLRIVLVNQLPEEAVTDILYKYRDLGLRYIRGSHAQEAVLERANVRAARAAVVLADVTAGIGSKVDETTVLAVLALKHLNPELRVTGEILDEQNADHLRRANADEVIISGEHNAFLLSAAVTAPGLSQAVRELLGGGRQGTELQRMALAGQWAGRTVGELAAHLRQRDGLLLIGLITEQRGITLDEMLGSDTSFIDDFIRRKFAEAGMAGRVWDAGGLTVTVNPDDAQIIGSHDAAIVVGRSREDRA